MDERPNEWHGWTAGWLAEWMDGWVIGWMETHSLGNMYVWTNWRLEKIKSIDKINTRQKIHTVFGKGVIDGIQMVEDFVQKEVVPRQHSTMAINIRAYDIKHGYVKMLGNTNLCYICYHLHICYEFYKVMW